MLQGTHEAKGSPGLPAHRRRFRKQEMPYKFNPFLLTLARLVLRIFVRVLVIRYEVMIYRSRTATIVAG